MDLEHPDNKITVLLSEGRCILTLVKCRIDRSAYEKRRPNERVSVHPSTMQPNFARALVNLARTPRDGTFLDPFCGVGGILIEAGLIGAKPIGIDIKSDLIKGARDNLSDLGIKNFKLIEGDARKFKVDKVDAIATDPPYGRQASTGGSNPKKILEDVMPRIVDALNPNKHLCMTATSKVDLEKIAKGYPLELREKHEQRVHKSLKRNVYVFRREKE